MPNAKVLSDKQAVVAQLTEKIQNATAGVLVDYKGINVEEDTALRRECRENGIDYAVVKNTLLRFAFNNTGLNELDGLHYSKADHAKLAPVVADRVREMLK